MFKLPSFRPGTITRISMGVAALIVMLLMALDFTFALIPDPAIPALERRRVASELLAERVTQIASQSGAAAVQKALHEARLADRQLRSAGLRRSDGELLATTGDHRRLRPANQPIDPQRQQDGSLIDVPVRAQGEPWGRLELVFEPLPGSQGLEAVLRPHVLWPAIAFLLATVLLRLYLGRVLHQLDPTAVVPERVRTAYNALAEAVVMVDAQGRIVLTNNAFDRLVAPRRIRLGRRLEDHPWVRSDIRFADGERLPWRDTLRAGKPHLGHRMELAAPQGVATDRAGAPPAPTVLGEVNGVSEVMPREADRVALVDCTPILDDRERVQGCLIVFQDQTEIERTNEELQRTLTELREANAQISEQHQEMMRLATLDPLTSCMNRRAFFEAARGQLQRCLFDGKAVAVIMVDIDHFKGFNDRYGHAIGDDVIRAVAKLLQTKSRPEDLVCRYGGEEFCVLMPECDAAQGQDLAERLRTSIASDAGHHIRELKLSVTASLGLAVAERGTISLEALIEEADQALYHSKRNGRNRVTLAGTQASASEPAPEAAAAGTPPAAVTTPPQVDTAPA